jgi:hypothetical protein
MRGAGIERRVGCRDEGAGMAPSWAAYAVGGARHESRWIAGVGFEQRGGIGLEMAAVGREGTEGRGRRGV